MAELEAWHVVVLAVSACALWLVETARLALDVQEDTLELVIKGFNMNKVESAKRIRMIHQKYGDWYVSSLLVLSLFASAGIVLSLVAMFPDEYYVGYLIAVPGTVLFGVFLPQIVASRAPLTVGAGMVQSGLIFFFMGVTAVLSFPLSHAISYMSNSRVGTAYNTEKVRRLFDANRQKGHNVFHMMLHASGLTKQTARDLMTPMTDVFRLMADTKLDFDILSTIFKAGYSRIPVFAKESRATLTTTDNVIGVVFVKDMMLLDPNDCTPVATILQFYQHNLPRVFADAPVPELLDLFKEQNTKMAVVQEISTEGGRDPFYVNVGIVTLDDTINAILDDDAGQGRRERKGRGGRDGDAKEDGGAVDPRVFDSRVKKGLKVTPQEELAVFYHLSGTVPCLQDGVRLLSAARFKQLIRESKVIECHVDPRLFMDSKDGKAAEEPDWVKKDVTDGGHYLYQRDVPSEYAMLILDGKAEIVSGRDHFKSYTNRWTFLCPNLLEFRMHKGRKPDLDNLPTFVPDFSCKLTKSSRVLRISQSDFVKALKEELYGEKRLIDLYNAARRGSTDEVVVTFPKRVDLPDTKESKEDL